VRNVLFTPNRISTADGGYVQCIGTAVSVCVFEAMFILLITEWDILKNDIVKAIFL
jgi:hypothetical protein